MRKESILPILFMMMAWISPAWALEPEPGMAAEQGEAVTPRLTFHGYGELHYNNPRTGSTVPSEAPAQMDFHRLVLGWAYEFNDRMSLHVEIDFEHAVDAANLELEFAYLDFLFTPALNIRAGAVLMPVGPLNEFHEPPLFYSVERPYVQTYIIPTTWTEGGAGIFGAPIPGLRYRLYVVSSLNGANFSADQGIRGGRGKLKSQASDDIAVVGRVEYVGLPGLDLGVSAYRGGVNATDDPAFGSPKVGIWEGDLRARFAGLDLRAVYAVIDVDGAAELSTATKVVGEKMLGWYAEAAYRLGDVMGGRWDIVPFVRWEEFNTQEEVPSGRIADPRNDREVLTIGIAYYPDPQIAIKIDREKWEDAAGAEGVRWNAGLGFMF